jgi:protein-tyrosine phosphatase
MGVDVVVSLLEAEEMKELDIVEEEELCHANGIDFISFPIRDREVPKSRQAALELAETVHTRLRGGKNVVIHCRAGIGRSSLMAACVLKLSGLEVDDALSKIASARGCPVPDTTEQHDWVAKM